MAYKRKKRKKKFYRITKILPKVFTSIKLPENIKNELILLGAFTGDYYKFTHFSHYPYLLGFKNNYSFYDIDRSLLLFINALHFLKKAASKPNTKFIFAGTPFGEEKQNLFYFKQLKLNHVFFPNERWNPGVISKASKTTNFVLIVYDINLNHTAYKEGVNTKIPVVGFVTSSNDIRGLDYPILLNLKNYPIWYVKLILALFYKN